MPMPTTKSIKSRTIVAASSLRGVSMLEFSIVIPVVLLIIFAILDLSIVMAARVMLTSALERTGLAAARMTLETAGECAAASRTEFTRQAGSVRFLLSGVADSTDFNFQITDMLPGAPRTVRASLNASIPCMFFCRLLIGRNGISVSSSGNSRMNFSRRFDYPLENQRKCK